jgi:hypothetical protein
LGSDSCIGQGVPEDVIRIDGAKLYFEIHLTSCSSGSFNLFTIAKKLSLCNVEERFVPKAQSGKMGQRRTNTSIPIRVNRNRRDAPKPNTGCILGGDRAIAQQPLCDDSHLYFTQPIHPLNIL